MREGKDITLVGLSAMTWVCIEAADALAEEGIEAEVVDVLSVSPLDYDHILDSVRKTEHLVIVDEDTPRCSVAADIAATVADEAIDYLDGPIKRVNVPHTPVPYSPNLEQAYIPNADRVLAAARARYSAASTAHLRLRRFHTLTTWSYSSFRRPSLRATGYVFRPI